MCSRNSVLVSVTVGMTPPRLASLDLSAQPVANDPLDLERLERLVCEEMIGQGRHGGPMALLLQHADQPQHRLLEPRERRFGRLVDTRSLRDSLLPVVGPVREKPRMIRLSGVNDLDGRP